MNDMSALAAASADTDREDMLDLPDDWLRLSEPDIGDVEFALVEAALRQPRLSAGRMVEHFEQRFAQSVGRRHAVAVASGTLGTLSLIHI